MFERQVNQRARGRPHDHATAPLPQIVCKLFADYTTNYLSNEKHLYSTVLTHLAANEFLSV